MGENYFEDKNGKAILLGSLVRTPFDQVKRVIKLYTETFAEWVRVEEERYGYMCGFMPGVLEVVIQRDEDDPAPSTPQRDEGERLLPTDPPPTGEVLPEEYGPVWLDRLSDRVDALIERMDCAEHDGCHGKERLDALEERVKRTEGQQGDDRRYLNGHEGRLDVLQRRVRAVESERVEDRAVLMGGELRALVDRVAALEMNKLVLEERVTMLEPNLGSESGCGRGSGS